MEISKALTYPFILKSIISSLGEHNFLIKDSKELCEILDSNPKIPFIIQEFIPNKFDYRVVVLGDKVGTILKRQRQDDSDHRNNVHLGASEVEIVKTDKKMNDISISAARILNKNIAGIDLIFNQTNKKYYIIEINSKPFFTYDTKISSEITESTKYIDSYLESFN